MYKLIFISLIALFTILTITATYADVNCQQQYAANSNELSVCTALQQQLTTAKNTFKKPFNDLANNTTVLLNSPSQNQTQQPMEQETQPQSNTNSVHIPYN